MKLLQLSTCFFITALVEKKYEFKSFVLWKWFPWRLLLLSFEAGMNYKKKKVFFRRKMWFITCENALYDPIGLFFVVFWGWLELKSRPFSRTLFVAPKEHIRFFFVFFLMWCFTENKAQKKTISSSNKAIIMLKLTARALLVLLQLSGGSRIYLLRPPNMSNSPLPSFLCLTVLLLKLYFSLLQPVFPAVENMPDAFFFLFFFFFKNVSRFASLLE